MSLFLVMSYLPAVFAGSEMPSYSIKITDISSKENDLDVDSLVTYTVSRSKVSGIKTAISSDKSITVEVTDRVDFDWDPEEIHAASVTDDYGSSVGSARDTWDEDDTYYKVSSENESGDHITDFTFTLDLEDDAEDIDEIYVTLSGDSPVPVKVRMYDGSNWKTVRTFDLEDYDDVEFSVGNEYVDSGELMIRLYTEDDDSYTVKIEHLSALVRSRMDVVYSLPEDTDLVEVGRCCGSSLGVVYTYEGDDVSFDLSDYVDPDDDSFGVEYTYQYTLTLSDYKVFQKTRPDFSQDSDDFDIAYEESFKIGVPFPQEIEIEATPSVDADFNALYISDKTAIRKEDNGKVVFEVDASEAASYPVVLSYSIKDAISLKQGKAYDQTSLDVNSLVWVSEYSLDRKFDIAVDNVSLTYKPVVAVNETELDVDPSTDHVTENMDNRLRVTFSSLQDDVTLSFTERSPPMFFGNSTCVQLSNPLKAGEVPEFIVDIGVRNPSDSQVKLVLKKSDVKSILPDIGDCVSWTDEEVSVDLKAKESVHVKFHFNSTPVSLEQDEFVQSASTTDVPVEWENIVKVANAGCMGYSNVSWSLSVPEDAYDCKINEEESGKLSGGVLSHLTESVEAGANLEYSVVCSTPEVRKTEDVIVSGSMEKKIEKQVSLVNPTKNTVTVRVVTNLDDVPNLEKGDLEKTLPDYEIVDRNDDGIDDVIKWTAVLGPYDEQTVVLKGSSGVMGTTLSSFGVYLGGAENNPIFQAILLVTVLGLIFIVLFIKFVRNQRRKRMILYMANVANSIRAYKLGGGSAVKGDDAGKV